MSLTALVTNKHIMEPDSPIAPLQGFGLCFLGSTDVLYWNIHSHVLNTGSPTSQNEIIKKKFKDWKIKSH